MKYSKKLILILMTCVGISSCGTSVVLRDHIALEIPEQCPYTKMSAEAKESLTDQAVIEIFENRKACLARAAKIQKLIDTHNKAYSK